MPSELEQHPDLESRVASVRQQIELNPQSRELTPRRLELMLRVVVSRLSSVTVVMENLWDPHNCSAVVRSAEALGLDRVHVVEDPHPYRSHPSIVHGADRVADHRPLVSVPCPS